MLGLLGLSGSPPLFLCSRNFSFSLATPLFSCYSVSPCIFPLIFPSVQMFLFDLFMSDSVSECPVHFLWEHSALISLHLDACFLQLCSPTPPVHSFPPFSWIYLLWCYLFLPLVRSLLLLYLFPSLFFPLTLRFSFLYVSSSCATHNDPEGLIFSPCLCKGDPHFSRALFRISALLFFFFSCIIFHFFFLCLQPLPVPRLVFCMTRIFLLPSPTFTWGTWEQMTSLAVSVLPQISPWGDLVSPQSRTEVLRRLVDRNWRMLLTWCRSSALLRLERSHGAV